MAVTSDIVSPKTSRFTRVRNWYGRWERLISSWSLLCGFAFDALTLRRVDLFWENFFVIAHIVIVGVCIVLIHAIEREEGAEANPSKLHFWLVNLQQFFYGGIWSVFLVFYFRSSDIAVSWPFLLILALSFIANERLKRSFVRLTFQISLFFLAIFCFAIFLVPVLLHKIGTPMFLLSGLVSLIFIALFLLLIRYSSKKPFGRDKWFLLGSIAGLFLLVNILYFTDLIPPIPLSLKEAGVYYSVQRNSDGNYSLVGEQWKWRDYFHLYPEFDGLPGQPVYVFSSIFSPPGINTTVIHEWQYLGTDGKWKTIDKVSLIVVGGRDGGFRTYSLKRTNLNPGKWRVNVLTTNGQLIGRIRFSLVAADQLPKVVQTIGN